MVRNRISDGRASAQNRDSKTPLIMLGVVIFIPAISAVAVAASTHTTTRTVIRVPAACTRAALAAAQNEIDWQATFQAHVNVEQEALDGETYRLYRQHLAEAPGPPKAVDLGSCR